MKRPELKLPDLKLPDLPRPVTLSLVVLVGSILFFAVFFFTIGTFSSDAESEVTRLKAEVEKSRKTVKQAKEDTGFVTANQARFETLMASDKLIPHTRRTAIRQMQALALEFGLSALNYNFQAAGGQTPESVSSQPKSSDYRVSIENIELTVGAPLDQNLYSFIAALHDDFPGSLVVTEFELERSPTVSGEALNQVSRGEDSGLVRGKIKYSWRTAQQNKKDDKK